MSDDLRFSLVISEGPHDVEAAAKVLRLKKFQRARKLCEVPALLQAVIPRHYPSENKDGELCRIWTRYCPLSPNSRLIRRCEASQYWQTRTPRMRAANAARSSHSCQRHSRTAATSRWTLQSRTRSGCSHTVGRLACTFSRTARAAAPWSASCLLKEAEKYVAYAKTLLYAKNLTSGSNGEKAVVGVIANALRPGKANQVSIHDDDWFTKESLTSLALHQALSEFIDTIIQWGR